MGLSGLLPVVHAILIFPLEGLMQRAAVSYYLVEGLVLLLGTGFYIVSLTADASRSECHAEPN